MEPTLVRGSDRSGAVQALADLAGGRSGIGGVLADLGRAGTPAPQQLTRVALGFTWDERDRADQQWWPQGVTGSWDRAPSAPSATGDGDVLVTTAYAKPVGGVRLGSRVTVHDVSDPARVRYEHVLLVHVTEDDDGRLAVAPVKVHAGGAAWVGDHLHVAATTAGFHTFHLADVIPAAAVRAAFPLDHGHRYLLPARTTHHSRGLEHHPLRFSFLSVAHESESTRLLVGEFGRGDSTTRLWSYDLDPTTGLPLTDASQLTRPRMLGSGPEGMQGAVLVSGRLIAATSRGRWRRGSLWSRRDQRWVEHEYRLPPGPEDLSHRPTHDQLWTLTEYPHSRMVVALDRRGLD